MVRYYQNDFRNQAELVALRIDADSVHSNGLFF